MTAATVCLGATSRVPTMCAAILIIGGCRTFARCVSAGFGRRCVIHFSAPMTEFFSYCIGIIAISQRSDNLHHVIGQRALQAEY